MLRATNNRWVGLFTNDVKRMMFNEFTGMNLYCDDEWFIQLSDIWKVLTKLAEGKTLYFYMDEYGNVGRSNAWGILDRVFTIFDERQAKQLFALNKLINVALYLNEKPLDWGDSDMQKWFIYYDHNIHKIGYSVRCRCSAMDVYFDSEEHANQAVEILDEDVVKSALGIFD